MRILSIDIGVKNCAFYKEYFDETKLTPDTLHLGIREYWHLADFSKGDVFVNIVAFLDKNQHIFDNCAGIIIEKQHKLNYTAQVIEHFIFGYFKTLYGPFKYISNISATRKTQTLGAPKKMDKKQRKKWAVNQAHYYLDKRNDFEGLKILHHAKADDLADSYLQLKAFQKLVFIEGKSP